MKTRIHFISEMGPVVYKRNFLEKLISKNLKTIPGVKGMHKILEINDEGKSFFIIRQFENSLSLDVHVIVFSRTPMIAVAADIRESLRYMFKTKLNLNLDRIDTYIEMSEE